MAAHCTHHGARPEREGSALCQGIVRCGSWSRDGHDVFGGRAGVCLFLKNIVYGLSGVFGNAATRLEAFTVSGGVYAYGGYPDIDGLFREQAAELDRKKREAILHRVQQLVHEKVMYLPIWQLAVLQGYGPRVAESGLGLIADYPWSAPYEDVKLK